MAIQPLQVGRLAGALGLTNLASLETASDRIFALDCNLTFAEIPTAVSMILLTSAGDVNGFLLLILSESNRHTLRSWR